MVWCHKTPHCLGVISEAPWGNPHGEWNTTIRSSCHWRPSCIFFSISHWTSIDNICIYIYDIYIYYVVLRIHTIIYLHAIIYGCMMVAEGTRQQFFERILSQHLWSRGHPWSLVLPRWRSGCLHLGILYTFTGKWPVRMSVYTPMGGEARGNLQHLLINFPRTFLNNQRCYKWRWFGYGKNRFQWCLGFISGSIWVYDGCMSSSEPEGYVADACAQFTEVWM